MNPLNAFHDIQLNFPAIEQQLKQLALSNSLLFARLFVFLISFRNE